MSGWRTEGQWVLLDTISDSFAHRRDVARCYAACIRYEAPVDWTLVNKAIVERWSESALAWIKRAAWKHVAEAAAR